MSMGNFNKYLRKVVQSIYKDGKIVEVEYVAGYSVNKEVIAILKLIVELVMTTEYVKPETKAVLLGSSYRNSGNSLDNVNSVKSRITYDLSKLTKLLGADFFERILYKQDIDISSYMTKINQLLEGNKNKSALDILQLKLPACSGKEVDYISQEDWMLLLYVFVKYSKNEVQRIEKQITSCMVDYLKYLESHVDSLNDIQQMHYKIINGFCKFPNSHF